MIGIDTNVLLRYLQQDDVVQTALATKLCSSLTPTYRGYISLVALAEVAWTLKRMGGVGRCELLAFLKQLIALDHVVFQSEAAVYDAIERFTTTRIDFPDCLIERTGHHDGCEVTMTFDRKASKCPGFRPTTVATVAALRAVPQAA